MPPEGPSSEGQVCPVDHKSRQAWLDQARALSPDQNPPSLPQSCNSTTLSGPQPGPQRRNERSYFSLDHLQFLPSPSSPLPPPPPPPPPTSKRPLDQSRVTSSIPRAAPTAPLPHPANSEHAAPRSSSGNWVYPSEQMFFDAMRRKAFSPVAQDMASIVPIHNAVNERAWAEIKAWEAGRGAEACGGPKLLSFSGESKRLTPKARVNTWLGYTAPFDRHDWVVDRCGTTVEYVIDFYQGREEGKGKGGPSFYLDVRPKLNSFEGWKMRAERMVGL